MKNALENGYCTGKYCRTFLPDGQGQQVQNPDGSLDRFCPRHWHEYNHNLEIAAEELRRQQGEKESESIIFGTAMAALPVLIILAGVLR